MQNETVHTKNMWNETVIYSQNTQKYTTLNSIPQRIKKYKQKYFRS